MNKILAAPSIFASNFFHLEGAVKLIAEAGADLIHYDVMDNHFVPNISFGPKLIADVSAKTSVPGEAHLMIDLPVFDTLKPYLELPLEGITIHYEAVSNDPVLFLEAIRKAGKKAGISIKPGTPVGVLSPFLKYLNRILLMSVEPGFSGQSFKPTSISRMKELRAMTNNYSIDLQIDGGIGRDNFAEVISAGSTNLVIGSAFFKDKNPADLIRLVHSF